MQGLTSVIVGAVLVGVRRTLGETHLRCVQCWKHRPLASFVGVRGRVVGRCAGCRSRYDRWYAKTPGERLRARRVVRRTGDGYTVRLALRSKNRKTGLIPVSTTDMASCPTSCPHMDRGCYAGYGLLGALWKEVAELGLPWDAFCAQVAALPAGTLWRHNDAGDLPGPGDALDRAALARLVRANRGRRGFTFTHKQLRSAADRRAVAAANAAGFVVNLSADDLGHADELAELGIGPVAVVLPANAASERAPIRTPAGRRVVVCPAVTSGLTCATCRLCAKPRRAVVGFPAHGQAAALVSLRATKTGRGLA